MKKSFFALAALVIGGFGAFQIFSASTSALTGNFSDVPPSAPHYDAIQYLKDQGIVEGYANGTYNPKQLVTKVEALKIILKGAGVDLDSLAPMASYSDIVTTEWYIPYVNTATARGIVSGNNDGKKIKSFTPTKKVNLAESLKMLVLAKGIDMAIVSLPNDTFVDVANGDWYAKYFSYAHTQPQPLIDVDGSRHAFPAKDMTRADLAEVIYRLLTHKKSAQGETTVAGNTSNFQFDCAPKDNHDNYRTDNTLAVDPVDHNILYVAVEYEGVYKSIDGGKNWREITTGLNGFKRKDNSAYKCFLEMGRIVIDPTNHDRLLLVFTQSPGTLKEVANQNGGLYESLDAGESWHQLLNDTMNASGSELSLAIDPKDPQTLYYGANAQHASWQGADPNKIYVSKGVLYKSTDGGATWEELPTGIITNLRANNVWIDPADSDHLLFGTLAIVRGDSQASEALEQKGLMESKDGGKSWVSLANKFPKSFQPVDNFIVAAGNSQHIYYMPHNLGSGFQGFYSVDGGKSFQTSNGAPFIAVFDPHDTHGSHAIGVTAQGIVESLDGGASWKSIAALPKELVGQDLVMHMRPTELMWDPQDGKTVYLSGAYGSVWKSTDSGKNWTLILSVDLLPVRL